MKKWFILISLIIVCILIKPNALVKGAFLKEQNLVVYIDPGHGGRDGGASSSAGDMEKDINLSVAKYLGDYLKGVGIEVLYTRDADYELAESGDPNKKRTDLWKRVNMINESKADLFISIHCNAIGNERWSGAQVFYNKKNEASGEVASKIQDVLNLTLENDRSAKTISKVLLIDKVKIPGALVELGFLSNKEEAALLIKDEYQIELANSIFLGVLDYFSIKK